MSPTVAFVRSQSEPQLPPPLFSQGALAWAKENLFSSITSTLITVLCVAAFLWTIPELIAWEMCIRDRITPMRPRPSVIWPWT